MTFSQDDKVFYFNSRPTRIGISSDRVCCSANSSEKIAVELEYDKTLNPWLPWQRPLGIEKN